MDFALCIIASLLEGDNKEEQDDSVYIQPAKISNHFFSNTWFVRKNILFRIDNTVVAGN